MTKVSKLLGLLAVALVVMTGALASGTGAVRAEPVNPARFVGTVMIDGAAAPAGTIVEARVGDAVCGVAQAFMSGGEARYAVDVEASQPDGNPACGTDGAQVVFYIGGNMALETGAWHNYQLNTLNLTYVTPTETPEPTETPVPDTPKPPDTGQGTADGGGSAFGVLAVLLGLGAVTFAAGGAVAARRSR